MAEATPHGLGYCPECNRRVPRAEDGNAQPHRWEVTIDGQTYGDDCEHGGKRVDPVPAQWSDVRKGHVITVRKFDRRPFKLHVHSLKNRDGSELAWVVGDRLTMSGKASRWGATIGHSGRRELVDLREVVEWQTYWVPYRLTRRSSEFGGGFHVVDIALRVAVGWVLPTDGQWAAYVRAGWRAGDGRLVGHYRDRKEAVGEVWINRDT